MTDALEDEEDEEVAEAMVLTFVVV